MPLATAPFAGKRFVDVLGSRMAYIDEGEGDPIVFQHGNPTSSYLWRNVMPHCRGLGRLVACDLIGMGDSQKLEPSGPDRYTYAEQREYLFALWDRLALGERVVLVLHDWGSALGFDWANQHRDRVRGIAYMEAIVTPLTWDDWPGSVMRPLSEAEMAEYRRPYLAPGEGRRPTLSWPRQIPVDGSPVDVVGVVDDYARWLSVSEVPKLFVNAEPGSILTGRQRDCCRSWPNQTEVTVKGTHFIQEDSPDEIGEAVADFVRAIRG